MTVAVQACSKIQLEKQTNGIIDNTKTWTFAIYDGPQGFGGTQISLQTTSLANNSTLFSNVVLSAYRTYTICELGVDPTTGWSQMWTINGFGDVTSNVYNPDAGEDLGNRCIDIGAGTYYALLLNTSTDATTWLGLNFVVNNIPPPGGDARTPGYRKNWNTCSKSNGNQAQKAHDKRFYILDDHLPITLWANSNVAGTSYTTCANQIIGSQFVLQNCESTVRILNTQDVSGKNRASDAAYTLAKHLLAYLLNQASGNYACAQAATAAAEAKALLASICFNGSSTYLDSKVKTAAALAMRNRALYLANILDQYNNNSLNCVLTINNLTVRQILSQSAKEDNVTELKVFASPNPFNDRVRFQIESPVSGHGNLEVFNMLGQKVKTVYEGHVEAGRGQVIEFSVPQTLRSNLIYVMRVGNHRVTGKLVRAQR